MKKDSPWLASEDILGLGDVKVTIENVFRHVDVEFEAGRKEKTVYSIKFKGSPKQLVVNSTNRKALVAKFGVNVKDWVGKQVLLYVDPTVRLMGKIVNGVRIK
jgi:hypothetical protein